MRQFKRKLSLGVHGSLRVEEVACAIKDDTVLVPQVCKFLSRINGNGLCLLVVNADFDEIPYVAVG